MPMPFRDKTGQSFGFWTVVSYAGRDDRGATKWICKCECGNERVVGVGSLMNGSSKSCGCKAKEMRKQKLTKHNMAGTPTYKSWHAMHLRCQGKGGHESYVERGIDVCERWYSFENFVADMGVRPEGTTLDRIDNTKGYTPENCRWADRLTQANNTRACVYHEVNGELLTVAQIARKYGIGVSKIRHGLRKGQSIHQAMTPARQTS